MSFPVLKKVVGTTGATLALQEALYSFIMAFIMITAARFDFIDMESKKDYIIIVAGVIMTWAVLDAILFYWVDTLDQRDNVRLFKEIRDLPEEEAIDRIMDSFSGTTLDLLDKDEERRICREIYLRRDEPSELEIEEDRTRMFRSALGCIGICAFTLIPLILPVLLIPDFKRGLVVASFLSSIALFVIGYLLGEHLGKNKWLFGIGLAIITWIVSFISMLTGG